MSSTSAALLPTQATATPGGQLEVTLNVTNAGDIVDRFRVEITGVPEEWCSWDAPTVSLFPGETKAVHLTIRPPTGGSATAGLHPSVTITVV